MKDDNINMDIQLGIDAISQTVEEINRKLSNQPNPESPLTADLLHKISETIEQAKKAVDINDLQKYYNALGSAFMSLQAESDKQFTNYLDGKIEEFRQLVDKPQRIENKYSIDFKSSKTVIAIIFLSLGLFCSLFGNYNQYQENSRLTDNDLKYRFVKMKNGILPDEITRLENFFFYSDSAYVVNNIRKSVIDYEHRLQEQVRKQEQKKKNEEIIHQLDKEIKELNIK